ncbi:MAG: YfhO family protein [Deltaproteobacteria bacterium]|nr:MAG: YfhO family protein [Deltaproteobacteria bacterium]
MTADTPDRNLARAAAAASLLVLVALFWPTALRRVFVYGDLSAFFLPMRIFLAEQLARGRAPIWMPDLFCGFYAHGEGQIGIFHPLRWLLYRFLPVPEAFNLECLLPYPLALIGVALFVRRLALPASAAIFGGATFAFSAYLTLRLTHVNALAVIAHLGWLLYAIDVALREPGRRRYRAWLAIALVTGSQLLVGYPVAIAYCWLIAAPYAVWTARSRGELAPLAAVASAIATGVLLGAIQLLPTYDYLMTSERADPSYEYLTEMSLHPLHLLSAVAPWLFRNHLFMEGRHEPLERAFYFGPVVPIAALWIALRWRALGEWRALVAGLAALSAVALILALGGHTFFYRPFLALPLVGWLRVPARYTVVLYFSGAVFTAIAFADLLRAGSSPEVRQRSRWLWIVPAASWLVAGVGLAVYQPIPEQARVVSHLLPPAKQLNDPPWILLGPIVFTLAAALFSAAARGRRAALFALIPLVLADQAAYAAAQWWVDPPCTIAEWRDRVLPRPVDPPLRVTTPKSYYVFLAPDNLRWWSATTPIVSGTQMVRGYVGLTPSARLDFLHAHARPVAARGR